MKWVVFFTQSLEDSWQHPQVWAHLPLDLHRTRCCQEQRPHLQISGQQVHHRLAHRLLLWWVTWPCGMTPMLACMWGNCNDAHIFRQQYSSLGLMLISYFLSKVTCLSRHFKGYCNVWLALIDLCCSLFCRGTHKCVWRQAAWTGGRALVVLRDGRCATEECGRHERGLERGELRKINLLVEQLHVRSWVVHLTGQGSVVYYSELLGKTMATKSGNAVYDDKSFPDITEGKNWFNEPDAASWFLRKIWCYIWCEITFSGGFFVILGYWCCSRDQEETGEEGKETQEAWEEVARTWSKRWRQQWSWGET